MDLHNTIMKLLISLIDSKFVLAPKSHISLQGKNVNPSHGFQSDALLGT